MKTPRKAHSITEAADILGVQGRSPQQRANSVACRLAFLGYTETCSRCWGSGNYSSCAMYGTTCFKCMGSGKQSVKLTAAVLSAAKVRIDAGELIPYFERLARIKKAKAMETAAWDFLKNAQVAKDYEARYQSDRRAGGRISDEQYAEFFASPVFVRNSEMGDAAKAISELVSDLNSERIDPAVADQKAAEIMVLMDRMRGIDSLYLQEKARLLECVAA